MNISLKLCLLFQFHKRHIWRWWSKHKIPPRFSNIWKCNVHAAVTTAWFAKSMFTRHSPQQHCISANEQGVHQAFWTQGHLAEPMGTHFKSIKVPFTPWWCWGYVHYTLAYWTNGRLCEVQGIWLNSWESILNPLELCLRCEDVEAICAVPQPAELMGGLVK